MRHLSFFSENRPNNNVPKSSREFSAYLRNLVLGVLMSAQFASAQHPHTISQSGRLSSMQSIPGSIGSSLDGTLLDPGHSSHSEEHTEKGTHMHGVLTAEFLSGAILPNGESATNNPVLSSEFDGFMSKDDISVHALIHDINPVCSDGDFRNETVSSLVVNVDHKPWHTALGIRHYDHTAMHPHKHLHDDGKGHKTLEITREKVRERYFALMVQIGYDLNKYISVFAGGEYDLGITRDIGTDETHLSFAGADGHIHLGKWNVGARLMLAHSHGNSHEPNATFLRPSFHLEREIFDHFYLTFFGEAIFPLDKNRDMSGILGFGGRVKF